MKKTHFATLFLIAIAAFTASFLTVSGCFGSTLAAADSDLTGKWSVHISVSGTEHDSICTFTQKETVLSGTCTTDEGDKPLTGSITGNKVSWTHLAEYNNSPITLKYTGTLDATSGKIEGTIFIDELNVDGDFTASPDKASPDKPAPDKPAPDKSAPDKPAPDKPTSNK